MCFFCKRHVQCIFFISVIVSFSRYFSLQITILNSKLAFRHQAKVAQNWQCPAVGRCWIVKYGPVWRAIWFHRRIRFSVPNPPADPVLIGGYGSGRNHIRRVAYTADATHLSSTVHVRVRTSLWATYRHACKRPITFARPKPPKHAKFAQNSLFFLSPLDTN